MDDDNNFKELDKTLFKENCSNYSISYMPSILPSVERIIVIGDLHGDYKLTIKCLEKARLIDNKLNWIGNKTIVVQVGDQIDSCRPYTYKCYDSRSMERYLDNPDDIKILNLFTELHKKAHKQGGAVISLLGNHELLNVLGNMNYVSYSNLHEFDNYYDKVSKKYFKSGEEARKYFFSPGQKFGKLLGCTRLSCIIIGSFLFVHAGIIPEFLEKTNIKDRNDIYKINYLVRKWLLGLINKDYIHKLVRGNKYSMFWNRVLGAIPPFLNNEDPMCINLLKPVLNTFKIGNMVIGHTPQYFQNSTGINETCDGKLWRVDFSGSVAFSPFDDQYSKIKQVAKEREPQVLEILNDKDIKIIK